MVAGRRGCLWGLAIAVVAFIVLLTVLDFVARGVAEHELATRAQDASGAQSASATVSGFPFLWDVLVEGSVHGVQLHLSGVPAGRLNVEALEVALTGTHIARSALFDRHTIHVTSIDSGSAAVTVTAGELSAAVGRSVSLPGDGRILVDLDGATDPAQVTVSSDELVITVQGVHVLQADLASNHLVPQCGLGLDVGVGQLTVTCQMSPVPKNVVQVLAGARTVQPTS